MKHPTDFSSGRIYSVMLLPADPAQPERLAGRLEHVLSGRRHDFVDGRGLLACLAHEPQPAASGEMQPSTDAEEPKP